MRAERGRGAGGAEEAGGVSMAVNPNSMTYWWPCVKALGVNMPRTVLVEIKPEEWAAIRAHIEGEMDIVEKDGVPVRKFFNAAVRRVYDAAEEFGRPVFVRGDQMAAKHGWKNTCYIAKYGRKEFYKHLMALAEDHELKLWLEGIPLLAFAVREFIPTKPAFYAFPGRMPITRERRLFFVKGEGVVCHHPYWPNDAISETRGGYPVYGVKKLPCEWPLKMKRMNKLDGVEELEVCRSAEFVGEALATAEHPAWSIDFLQGANGIWYFTDCAEAPRSFHWIGCPVAIKRGWPQSR